MTKMTSAEAAKLLRKLNEELDAIIRKEAQSKDFLAALGEDPESVRPKYDYSGTSRQIDGLEARIRQLKHAINLFNTTTAVPEIGMTVDQALVYIPQLTKRCEKLRDMMNKFPKTRETAAGFGRGSALIDYRYLNYDAAEVEADYREAKRELDTAQLQLDLINSTAELSVDDSVLG